MQWDADYALTPEFPYWKSLPSALSTPASQSQFTLTLDPGAAPSVLMEGAHSKGDTSEVSPL